MQKNFAFLLLLLMAAELLSSCNSQQGIPDPSYPEPEKNPSLTLTVCIGQNPDSLNPARNSVADSETVFFHLFENLMRWVDDGTGWATVAPGQAESYSVEFDYAGNATYSFSLRNDIFWSDGQPVTAANFVAAWRQLADPANKLPHRELLKDVSGYDQVQREGNPSLLAVSAPDQHTFVVKLNGSCPYFLEEICASVYTMPIREDGVPDSIPVSNGAYTITSFTPDMIILERSETYYDREAVGPDCIQFAASGPPDSDYQKFLDGNLDLITNLPDYALRELAEQENWLPEPVTSVYGVQFHTKQPPFDDPKVRLAFRLAIDTQTVTEILDSPTVRPAAGIIPYGVTDYGERVSVDDADSVSEKPVPYWDFRSHSLEKVTVPVEGDYAVDCQKARTLMAQAGFPNGTGFPVTEYLYVESAMGYTVARELQKMWRDKLGVLVSLRGLSQEKWDDLQQTEAVNTQETDSSTAGSFAMAAEMFSASFSDAEALLWYWYGGNLDNMSRYENAAFDILIDSAKAATTPDVRDALLHDAEAILLTDVPVIPVFFQGGAFRVSERMTGMYRAPDGVFFLGAVTQKGET